MASPVNTNASYVMTAIILSFPSSRQCRAVRVEYERDGLGGWLTLWDACGELHGDYAAALSDAYGLATELGVAIVSSAGRHVP
jgi:hypothetical protein